MEVTTIRSVQQQVLKLTAGVPLVLCSGERISHLGECVLLSASERRIRLKLDGRAPELSVDHPTSYVLIPSVTAGVLHSLTKFLSVPSFFLYSFQIIRSA